jgi:hypothetical protein
LFILWILGTAKIQVEDVNVVNPTKIKCLFNLMVPVAGPGKWNVTNPDGQGGKDSLVKFFEIPHITSL